MNDANELLEVVSTTVAALRRNGIPYFVTGSFASSVHGEFRATNDIDIVAAIDATQLTLLFDELSAMYLTDLEQAQHALERDASFNLIHLSTYLKVDVFPCVSAFNQAALRRAVTITLPGSVESIRVASLEDIILSKIWWYRLGNEVSERQQRDVLRLVELNRDRLDFTHLREWADVLKVADLLQRFLG